jgi:hypothetical protein
MGIDEPPSDDELRIRAARLIDDVRGTPRERGYEALERERMRALTHPGDRRRGT